MSATLGHNNPPTPLDEATAEIDGLYDEAKHWLDGSGIQSDADASGIAKLLDLLRKAEKKADAQRAEEKKPHDEAGKAVQAKWRPVLEKAKRAIAACRTELAPWLEKKEAEQRAEAESLRRDAEKAQADAEAAFRGSDPGELEAREQAEQKAELAKDLAAQAARAAKAKPHAEGGSRAIGLRTYRRAEVTDATAFARFVWQHHRAELLAFMTTLAQRLVDGKQADIPGVTIHEDKRAA